MSKTENTKPFASGLKAQLNSAQRQRLGENGKLEKTGKIKQ